MGKEICQYTIEGELIKIWPSMKEANLNTGINNISRAAHGHTKSAGGYVWRFIGDNFNKYGEFTGKSIAVDQYDLDGNFIKTFPSYAAASLSVKKDVNLHIGEVIRGVRSQSGGYVWRKNGEPFNKYITPVNINIPIKHNKWTRNKFIKALKRVGNYRLISEFKSMAEKVDIICNECSNEQHVTPNAILKRSGCPYCSGKLGINTDTLKNKVYNMWGKDITVIGEYTGSNKKVLVEHNTCGAKFYITPSNLTKSQRYKTPCPYCNPTGYTTESFKYAMYLKGIYNYTLIDNYVDYSTHLRFKNNNTGDIILEKPTRFLKGYRGRNRSHGESFVIAYLEQKGIKYSYQYTIHVQGKRLMPDFYLSDYNAFIEFDGTQHVEAKRLFGGEEGLRKTQERDALKNAYAYEQGIKMIRIPYCYLNHIKEFLDPFFAKNEPIKKQ